MEPHNCAIHFFITVLSDYNHRSIIDVHSLEKCPGWVPWTPHLRWTIANCSILSSSLCTQDGNTLKWQLLELSDKSLNQKLQWLGRWLFPKCNSKCSISYAVFGKPLLRKKKKKAKDRGFIEFSSGYFNISLKFWSWIKPVRTLQTIVTIEYKR